MITAVDPRRGQRRVLCEEIPLATPENKSSTQVGFLFFDVDSRCVALTGSHAAVEQRSCCMRPMRLCTAVITAAALYADAVITAVDPRRGQRRVLCEEIPLATPSGRRGHFGENPEWLFQFISHSYAQGIAKPLTFSSYIAIKKSTNIVMHINSCF